ncbi:galactose-1-phosphate uridylyltransferase [Glycomyces tritici]|uniref:Galactose-1-phosphate uridylyltransferase n=1 Tax=Glycomyces tritici TaxID=2665176 RepID=A0ABT7YS88_9ACTN|nr:galactose-1-phosphate uridylyltransferase [Glycomyces tritici]MDN3241128.1 galactose-1-phosphate uridylyltransferase [Glycomyces tritici]
MRPEFHMESGSLADGRQILYYSTESASGRAAYADKRDLGERVSAGEIRYDRLRDEWVAVSAGRSGRPNLPVACPLCPSHGDELTEVPAPDYEVAVFENRFPSFGGFAEPGPLAPTEVGPEMEVAAPASGRCEVVVFSDDHDSSLVALSPERVALIVRAQAQRTADLYARGDVAQVFCFENRGVEVGVTLHHPHGQIYGYPYVTPQTRKYLDAAKRHKAATGRDLFDDIIESESRSDRVILENEHWIAFTPFAARWPFEVQIYPKARFADLTELPEEYIDSFAPLYLDLLQRCDAAYPGEQMPYMSGWHQAPTGPDREFGRLRLELVSIRRGPGRVKFLASSESVMGGWVHDMGPETSAALLKNSSPKGAL